MGAALEEVTRRLEALRTDREHGATFLAREAVHILALAAGGFAQPQGLQEELRQVAEALYQARPTMAAVKNVVRRFLWGLETQRDRASPSTRLRAGPSAALRTSALALCSDLERWLDLASEKAVQQGAGLLPTHSTIFTCSFSSTVVRVCQAAREAGKEVHVLALESRMGDLAYGERVAAALREAGVPNEVVPDSLLRQGVQQADLALVGADKVLPQGAVINGTPTLEVARAARGRAPFYVVCESFKLDDDPYREEGFDLVPPELVTAIATDLGLLRPGQVRRAFQGLAHRG
ncbi:MAG: hypothetical protein ACE5IG_04495 [Dehalococcoidia bacterium]